MHYEDQARRFNLLSGFLFGTLVGTGVALLRHPLGELREATGRALRRRRRRRALQYGWTALRHEAPRAVASLVRAGGHRLSG